MDEGRKWKWNRWRRRVGNQGGREKKKGRLSEQRMWACRGEGKKRKVIKAVNQSVIQPWRGQRNKERGKERGKKLRKKVEGGNEEGRKMECRGKEWLLSEPMIKWDKEWPCNQALSDWWYIAQERDFIMFEDQIVMYLLLSAWPIRAEVSAWAVISVIQSNEKLVQKQGIGWGLKSRNTQFTGLWGHF